MKQGIGASIRVFIQKIGEALKQSPKEIRDRGIESVRSVSSSDVPTRRMAWFFILSLIGLLVTLSFAGRMLLQARQVKKAAQAEVARIEAEKKAREEELRLRNRPPTYQSLGQFSLELKEKAGVVRARNSLNSVELEIVVVCDLPVPCEYIQKNLDAARGELLPLFVPADRDRILSIPGKKIFREDVRLQLNRWLERRRVKEGNVIDILLPRFIAS